MGRTELYRTQIDPCLRDGTLFTIYFAFSTVIVFGVMTLFDQF